MENRLRAMAARAAMVLASHVAEICGAGKLECALAAMVRLCWMKGKHDLVVARAGGGMVVCARPGGWEQGTTFLVRSDA
ncbi:hypothetical protein E2562_022805 [Oryza meyeriana var. granulata]|uniref:Uncharacterized protein n=1 Tax=Oryza meyeriana var. granulata TaxID=110450 RepID=A0A6G1FB57_9ORYZ|nr:hypothetical protein E2562_022805 [Oryza meyeriana var. granulata]